MFLRQNTAYRWQKWIKWIETNNIKYLELNCTRHLISEDSIAL